MLRKILVLLTVILVSMSSYGKTSVLVQVKSTDEPTAEKNIYETKWILSEFMGKPSSQYSFEETPYIMINENEKKLSGFGGVNRLFGSVFIDKTTINFGQIASTKMAGPFMNFESDFINSLSKVTSYDLEGNNLLFRDKDLNLLMKFSNFDESKEKKSKVEVSGEINYEVKVF